MEPIVELTPALEAELRRRYETAQDAVCREIGAMGWLYRRGKAFPYWPVWLHPDG